MNKETDNHWIHRSMVWVSVVVLFASLILHQMSPQDELYVLVATTALGFLFGKWTNGYPKPRCPDREDES